MKTVLKEFAIKCLSEIGLLDTILLVDGSSVFFGNRSS